MGTLGALGGHRPVMEEWVWVAVAVWLITFTGMLHRGLRLIRADRGRITVDAA